MLPGPALREEQGCNRKRVYPFEPDMTSVTNFSRDYLAHLLPTLVKIWGIRSCSVGGQEKEIEKMVLFQVNMALAHASDGRYAWSRALRRKLEAGTKLKRLPTAIAISSTVTSNCKPRKIAWDARELWALPPPISRPRDLAFTHNSHMKARPNEGAPTVAVRPRAARRTAVSFHSWALPGEDQKPQVGMTALRRVLPGGDDLGDLELLSELRSYVIHLEMLVGTLRSLFSAHEEESHTGDSPALGRTQK